MGFDAAVARTEAGDFEKEKPYVCTQSKKNAGEVEGGHEKRQPAKTGLT